VLVNGSAAETKHYIKIKIILIDQSDATGFCGRTLAETALEGAKSGEAVEFRNEAPIAVSKINLPITSKS
jgi:hypothetical protein